MLKDKYNVCFVVNSLNQKDPLYDLVPALNKHSNIDSIKIIAWFNYNDNIDLFEQNADVLHLDADREHFGFAMRYYKTALDFIDGCHVIQSNTTPAELHAKLLGVMKGIPIVHREGNLMHEYDIKIRFPRFVSNLFVDRIVCVSDAVADSFGVLEDYFLEKKKSVIYNGVDLKSGEKQRDNVFREKHNIPLEDTLVTIAASLKQQKGYDTLLRSIQLANKKSENNIRLAIAGDGELRGKLEKLTKELGIENCVHFLGLLEREEVYEMNNDSDMFVMPSRYEGFCVAVLQAMSSKIPCILTDIEPFRRYFDHSAVFVSVDDVDELSDAIVSLSEDETMKDYYAKKGYDTVSNNYSREKMAKHYEQVYAELVNADLDKL